MCGERCQEAKDFHRHILRGLSETFLDGSKTHNTFTLVEKSKSYLGPFKNGVQVRVLDGIRRQEKNI